MSAIVGIYRLDGGGAEASVLEGMLETMAHRGWDASGAWLDGPVGLGHRMLWTTPESREEKLPAVSAARDLVVTADARIDNRDELLRGLDLSDETPRTITDSELILASYRRWGEGCVEHLLGDFAFAIWDLRRERLFCARDHIGLKPFYYHYRSEGIFVFGSEVKALLAVPAVPRRVNGGRVAGFLVGLYEDPTATFHDEILRLAPAHCMTVSREGISLRRYWELDPSRELRLGSDAEYAEASASSSRRRFAAASGVGIRWASLSAEGLIRRRSSACRGSCSRRAAKDRSTPSRHSTRVSERLTTGPTYKRCCARALSMPTSSKGKRSARLLTWTSSSASSTVPTTTRISPPAGSFGC